MSTQQTTSFSTGRLAVGVFVISGSLMALEILYVRVVSVLLYPIATYLVISLALLGLGASGGLLSLRDNRTLSARVAGFGAAGFSFAILFSMVSVWFANRNFIAALALPIVLSLPMFFGGITVSAALTLPNARIPVLYFADLVGAGTSAGLVLLSLNYFGALQVSLGISIAGLISAISFFTGRQRLLLIAPITMLGLLLGLTSQLPKGIAPISPKELKLMLGVGAEVQWEYQGWSPLARVDVLSIPGDTLTSEWKIPYKLVTHDGGAPSLLIGIEDDSDGQFLVDNTIFGVAYWIQKTPKVLIIGLGGGPDVLAALAAQSPRILGAEVNPKMVAVVEQYFADFVGHPYSDPRVQIELTDGRHLLARTDEKFDIIQLTGVDTTIASLGANPNLAENYLYTREAFIEYIAHLDEAGVLSVSFPNVEGLGLRLLTLANEALSFHGIGPLSDYVIVSEMTGYVHVLIHKSPFTPDEVNVIREHYAHHPTSIYFPLYNRLFGTPDAEFISESRLVLAPGLTSNNLYSAYIEALQQGEGQSFLAAQPQTVAPPSDEWPFFFVLDKVGYRSVNYDTLFLTLALLLAFSFLLTILPPFFLRRQGLSMPKSGVIAAYFACLGLGFIFVEVILIQKLSLIVGHPSYALAITLSSLLIASGIGSLLSERVATSLKVKAVLSAFAVSCLILSAHFVLDRFGELILVQSLPVRVLSSALIVAAPGVFMGIPFPTGLLIVKSVQPNFAPWGWGINATFTVIGTILSLLLALSSGFGIVLRLAALLYILALFSMLAFFKGN
jgi:hypothetical protein